MKDRIASGPVRKARSGKRHVKTMTIGNQDANGQSVTTAHFGSMGCTKSGTLITRVGLE